MNKRNEEFWDYLCGSWLAEKLGINEINTDTLKKFDKAYFQMYPYLLTNDYISFNDLKEKNLLEVGLGFGSLSQKLLEAGAHYTGLDIASAPVDLVSKRISWSNFKGKVKKGNFLKPIFPKESFDIIVAIGCFHHTGDLRSSIEQCYSLLHKNGKLIFMVYSAYSHRRWLFSPIKTCNYLYKEFLGYRDVVGSATNYERAMYDSYTKNGKIESAPHTDFISTRSLKNFLSKFSSVQIKLENLAVPKIREILLKTKVQRFLGTDIYVVAKK